MFYFSVNKILISYFLSVSRTLVFKPRDFKPRDFPVIPRGRTIDAEYIEKGPKRHLSR